MGDTCHSDAMTSGAIGDEVGRRATLDSRTDRQDDLSDPLLPEPRLQRIQSKILGTDAVQGRKPSAKHEIEPPIADGLLDRDHLGGLLDHAELRGISPLIGAQGAERVLAQGTATRATPNPRHGLRHETRQARPTLPIALQQIESDALRRLRTHARKTAEGIDQLAQ